MTGVHEERGGDVPPVRGVLQEERRCSFDEDISLLKSTLMSGRHAWETSNVLAIADRRWSAIRDVGLEETADRESRTGR
eukprot:4669306-Pleurochrysis_carterae.AAC.1